RARSTSACFYGFGRARPRRRRGGILKFVGCGRRVYLTTADTENAEARRISNLKFEISNLKSPRTPCDSVPAVVSAPPRVRPCRVWRAPCLTARARESARLESFGVRPGVSGRAHRGLAAAFDEAQRGAAGRARAARDGEALGLGRDARRARATVERGRTPARLFEGGLGARRRKAVAGEEASRLREREGEQRR